MTQSKKNKIIIGTLVAVVLLMVVGYAAFSTSLNVSSTSNITTNWNIKITNISMQEKSSGATDTSEPTYDNTNGLSATFNTSFAKPGDYETYKIEITNSGDFNAKLSNIVEPTSSNPDISFYVNKDKDNTDIADALTQNGILNKSGETGNVGYVYVTVLYKNYDNQQSPSDSNRTATATIKFDFEQTDESAVVTPPEPSLTTVYAYHTDEKTIGTTKLIESEYVTDYTMIEGYNASSRPYFLKYEIDGEGTIQNAYACIKASFVDNPICLQGGNPEYYSANKSILEGLKPTYESQGNGANCSLNDSSSSCSRLGGPEIIAESNGNVSTETIGAGCYINNDGSVLCGKF